MTENPRRDVRAARKLGGGVGLGRPFGVELRADWSLLIIFGLIAVHLGAGVFPAWHPDWSPGLSWLMAVLAAALFFASVALHELSHAVVARRNDIPVRRITLFVFGGMAHLDREPLSPGAEFRIAIVGPLTSLALGVAALALGGLLSADTISAYADDPEALLGAIGPVTTLLLWLGPINIILGVFNLVPGFPLDGGRVLRAALWWGTGNLERATRGAAGAGQLVGWTLMALGVSMLLGVWFPVVGGGPVQGLWFVLIGWFLAKAARMSYEQLLIRQALEDVPVTEVMRSDPVVVDRDLTLAELVRDLYMRTDQRAFPVVHGGELLGIVDIAAIQNVPRDAWSVTTVADVMEPVTERDAITPDDTAIHALQHLSRHDPVPVVANGRILGVVRGSDLMRWLALRTDVPAGAPL